MEEQQPAVRPTKKQQELLAFIDGFIREHGYSPSYREIMVGVGYSSVATVALHVNNLIRRGHLIKRGRSARSIEVIGAADPTQPSISTNYVQPSEERWLVEKVTHLFEVVEQQPSPARSDIDQLAVVLAGLRILGLEQAAQSFHERLRILRDHVESSTE